MGKDAMIAMIEAGRRELERTARAVPDDKLNWKPLDKGRSALDAPGDAAQAPTLCTSIIRGTVQYSPEVFRQMAQERAGWTRDEALQHLETNTQELIAEIQKLSEEKLNEPLTLPMGGGMTLPWRAWILMSYRSFISRTAQINYIQTLYGDFDFH